MSTEYDVYIVNPARRSLSGGISGVGAELLRRRGYAGTRIDLESGRRVLETVKAWLRLSNVAG